MFCMHHAFEDEGKARGLLNIAGTLMKGGKFIGTLLNSDILREKVIEVHEQQALNPPKPQANGLAKAAAQAVVEATDGVSTSQTSAAEANWRKHLYQRRTLQTTKQRLMY